MMMDGILNYPVRFLQCERSNTLIVVAQLSKSKCMTAIAHCTTLHCDCTTLNRYFFLHFCLTEALRLCAAPNLPYYSFKHLGLAGQNQSRAQILEHNHTHSLPLQHITTTQSHRQTNTTNNTNTLRHSQHTLPALPLYIKSEHCLTWG